MKKRILSIFFTVTMLLTLMPMAVFAKSGFKIINGTPESAKETNHGYISIDKETAAEGEPVTVTVNPAKGYQLKSLTATPVAPTINTIADVLATVEGFPTSEDQNTPPSSAWVADVQNNQKCYAYTSSSGTYTALLLRIPTVDYTFFLTTTEVTPGENCYTASNNIGTLKFNMTDGVLTDFTYTHKEGKKETFDGIYAPASTPSPSRKPITPAKQTDGTYQFTMPAYAVIVTAEFEEKAITIADILPDDFPTYSGGIPSNAWKNSVGSKMYINNNGLTFGGVSLYNILSKPVTKDGNNYKYISNPYTITFVMDSDKLVKVITEGAEKADNNGEYIPSHTHTFTYTVDNGKITATCTEGCDKGYDTTPLTLTLTAPASLVYDGNAKAFTFADGEEDAWTGAELELPTITYYQKYSGQGWYTRLNEVPVNAGGDYMAEIVVNNKAAQVKFTIDKATPYIKTNPEPTDIDYGKKLADSTLVGGYVQVSSTNTTQVGGLFEWTNPDTIPALSDSETTEYDVTFTPADTNNYNTVSSKVKIKVTHTHNPVKVNGQSATETASGWKDYYECDCGALFEEATGNTPIENFDTWKAAGGNGYIAKLVHGTDANNDHICDYCNKQVSECKDENKDHKCDICEKVISNHNGVLQHGVAATLQKAGYKDYYKCDICGKFFEDAACKIEITNLEKWKSQGGNGYIAKLKEDPKSPQTGDTFNMTSWIVLLILSAMGICACLVLRRKKELNNRN